MEHIAHISSLSFIISQRLHASILAHSYGIPCIALAYDEKVTDHFLSMQQENFKLSPINLSSEDIRVRTQEIKRYGAQIRLEICKRRDLFIDRQFDFFEKNILPACSN